MSHALGWSDDAGRTFGALVRPGCRVLVKPNLVLHANQGPWGLDPLITSHVLIRAVAEAALEAGAGEVVIADAPVQGCDFAILSRDTGLGEWADRLQAENSRFKGLLDLRRTIRAGSDVSAPPRVGVRPADRFTLYDLGPDSLLEPITTPDPRFRVTQYHPEYLGRTHAPGKHQYLVAREVPDADLIINLPKLKTHKKAGVTCALKNLVGINGNKEYLPHHRTGSPAEGGDCYPESSRVKRAIEWGFDRFNSSHRPWVRTAWSQVVRALLALQHRRGDTIGVEGSWSGNDTVWRMCLDLNRILLYGTVDGTFGAYPQRQAIHVVDAIVAGQGDGPLNSAPLPLGVLLAGESAAAVDWVAAQLLGYDARRIPIAHHAFDSFRWPLTAFPPGAVTAVEAATGRPLEAAALADMVPEHVDYPAGWLSAVRGRA